MKVLGFLFFLPLIGVITAQDYCPSEATGCQDCSTRFDYNNITSAVYLQSNGKCTAVFSWPFEYQPEDSNPWLQFSCEYTKTGEICNSGFDRTCASCLTYTITDLNVLDDPYVIYYDSCNNFFDIPLAQSCVNALISTTREETTATTAIITTTTTATTTTTHPSTVTTLPPITKIPSVVTSHYPTTTERGQTTPPPKSTSQEIRTITSTPPVVTTHKQRTSTHSPYCPDYKECQECPINYKIPIFTQYADLYGNSECTITFTWEYDYERNIGYEFFCQYNDGENCITDGPYVCGSCRNYTIHNLKNYEEPALEYQDSCGNQIPVILTPDCFWG